jgi:hypothetical protein
MVQKARREQRYAGCSPIVPEKSDLESDLLREHQSDRWLFICERLVRGWTSNIVFSMDLGDSRHCI